MKRKTVNIIIIVIFIITLAGCILWNKHTDKKDKSDYIPCVSLSLGETYDIEAFPAMHANRTAEETASDRKNRGKCVDAWVNERGNEVERYDKATLEAEYTYARDLIIRVVEQDNKSYERVEVSYDCSVITFYVYDSTTMVDWTYPYTVLSPACMSMQLLAGIPHDDVKLTVKIIYYKTGEEMFNLDVMNGFHITNEEWNSRMEEMKR